jgi:hypothetical protein
MRKVNRLIFMLSLIGLSAYAQNQGLTTLNQAIAIAKQRKAAELSLNTDAYASSQTAAANVSTSNKQVRKPIPQLWSIQGVGNELKAEVIYQGRIHELSFENNAIRIGDWLLESLTAKEIVLVQPKLFGKAEITARREIHLQVPSTQQAVQIFPMAAVIGNDSPGAIGDESQGKNATTGRPPVPFELLRQ